MKDNMIRMGKIYKGYTRAGEEKLFEELFSQVTGWYFYLDLETNKKYDYNHVDISSLVKVASIGGLNKRGKRRKIVKAYKLNRERLIDTKDLVFGDIKDILLDKIRLRNHVFLQHENVYQDINNDRCYELASALDDESRCGVTNIREFSGLEGLVPKRKILEYRYQTKGK